MNAYKNTLYINGNSRKNNIILYVYCIHMSEIGRTDYPLSVMYKAIIDWNFICEFAVFKSNLQKKRGK